MFAKRPRTWRNHVREAHHVQAPLRVDADGDLVHPYITWFIDCATKAITGVEVTTAHLRQMFTFHEEADPGPVLPKLRRRATYRRCDDHGEL
ncbi:hypothetical protein [Embleya sp. NPDC005575]|uniref:hypothetical protein n=1 Tax=Embleya sp. NPDC005575 TaxID=3156892 RepID=UPI0033B471F0